MLPIRLFETSCEEAIELSAEEVIRRDCNATAIALAGEKAAQICLVEYGEGQRKRYAKNYEKSLKILDEI